jgi:phosphate transport system substrate-binding protein
MWNKRLIAAFTSGLLAVSLAACGSSSLAAAAAAATAAADSATTAADAGAAGVSGSVTASGSSALLPLVKAAADAYMSVNADVSVTVNGGGSGTGLKQVADGSVDIGDSDVFAEEKLDADVAKTLTDHEVAVITMAPVTSKSLGVTNLTTQQLTDIFTAKITNWKEVGGPDKDIVLVTRPSSSGTRALFQKWALGGASEADNKALETDDSGTLMQTIKDNDGAIGYVALSYLVNNTDVQAVSIDGVAPTLENTYSGAYKVWGFEHMYTKGDGSAAAQGFIQYITGDAFSAKMEGMGYGVAAKMSSAAVSSHK